jgi:hypothetical protein
MKPRTVVHNLPRHEIGASQMLSPKKRYCSARHDINEVISICRSPELRNLRPDT